MADGRAVAEALRIGEKVGEVEITLTDEMIDAYAAAVGDFSPLFMEREYSMIRYTG